MTKEIKLKDYKGRDIRMDDPVTEVTVFGQTPVLVHTSDMWDFSGKLSKDVFIYERKTYESGWQYLESNMGIEH